METEKLIQKAFDMLNFSYAPYSNFKVGASLLSNDGRIWGGCNIENSAFGPSNCAERTAIFKAVSEGVKDFQAICIVGGKEGNVKDFCPPCGVCRQVMREFCSPDFKIILAKSLTEYKVFTLAELLPESFSL
ncbi:MAG: cytidine deaminase [Treponema sp.]|nr:cytidine deaminase [Treponema sp.]